MKILLHAPSDFNNLCVLARTLECFGVGSCAVYDPHRLIRERYGKSYTRKLRKISVGAFSHIAFQRIDDPESHIRAHAGRSLATVPGPEAPSLYGFSFADDDLLVVGSEAEGLPAGIIAACTQRLAIPQSGVTQSLNLAVAAGVLLWEWRRQQEADRPGRGPAAD